MNKIIFSRRQEMDFINQHIVMSKDLNPANSIFGGQVLAWLDEAAALYVMYKIKYTNIVTFSMTDVLFKNPAKNGDHLKFFGEIVETKSTRAVVRVKAVAANPETQIQREIITCTVTFVCLNEKGKPYPLFKVREKNGK